VDRPARHSDSIAGSYEMAMAPSMGDDRPLRATALGFLYVG